MKGKAQSLPTNHVVWANGFKSNMPDWPTARRVACSDRLLFALRETRSLLFAIERGDTETFEQLKSDSRWSVLFDSIQEVIDYADLGIEHDPIIGGSKREDVKAAIAEVLKPMPPPPGFPKPPGVV